MNFIEQIKNTFFGKLYKLTIAPRARIKFKVINTLLSRNAHIIEIGSGNCGLANLLQIAQHKVITTDIVDHSFYNHIKPIIFNGKKLPFADKSFDYALIITVLHHTCFQEELILEAKRTSEKIIIMEDIYSNKIDELLIKFTDSLVNFDFINHPHTNRKAHEWEKLFGTHNLLVLKKIEIRTLGLFKQVFYLLQ